MTTSLPATPDILQQYSGLKFKTPGAESFIADSSRVVLKLLQSGLEVQSILATPDWYEMHHSELAAANVAEIYHAPLEILQDIIGFSLHQGVMARAKRPADVTLAELLPGPLLVMDGVAKTDNVGAIIRNAAAFGITRILIDARTCHPFQRRAVRTSMGNVYGMKVHQTAELAQALRWLKTQGIQVVGFENRPQAVDLAAHTFGTHTAIIIGSEASGMSPEVLAEVQHLVRIPIDAEVYALNAACASAVALYALTNQNQPGTLL